MQPSSFNEPNLPLDTAPQGASDPNAQSQSAAALPPVAPLAAPIASTQPVEPIGQTAVAAQAGNGPELADDGDLIEKEWVSQVKRIVTATANDPYQQNVEFTRLKAEYMQKRYGKQIKVED